MGFLSGFSIAMGANIIVFVLSLVNNKIIYLFLSETDNGVFFLVMRSSLFLALFFGDWLRLSSMNIAGKDKRIIPVLSANGFWYSIILALIFTIPAIIFSTRIEGTLLGIPARYLPAVFLVGAALIARNNWQSLLLVAHRMFSYGFTFILWISLFLLLDVYFIVILRYGLNFVIAAFIAASFVSALWAFFSSCKANGHSFRFSLSTFGMSGKIGARAWMAVLGMFLMTNIHAFTVGTLAGSVTEGLVMVAIFSVSFRVFSLFQRGADVAGTVLYSHVVQQDETASSRMTMLVTRNIILLSIVFALLGAVFGKVIILIISSSRYIEAYIPLLFMLPGIVCINAGSVINNYYWGRTYPLKIIVAPFVAAVFGLFLNVLLVPRIGVSGATLSFSLMSVLWFVYQVVRFANDSGRGFYEVLVPRVSDVARIMSRITEKFKR